jgi:hypothetical protein
MAASTKLVPQNQIDELSGEPTVRRQHRHSNRSKQLEKAQNKGASLGCCSTHFSDKHHGSGQHGLFD